jgi:hypothetical protein
LRESLTRNAFARNSRQKKTVNRAKVIMSAHASSFASPAVARRPAATPGAPLKKRGGIVKKTRRAPGSLEARKAADRLRDILGGKVALPKDGVDKLLAAVRADVDKLTREAQENERAVVFDEYAELCADHGHVCGICTDPLAPKSNKPCSIRGTGPVCSHLGNYHLTCLLKSEMHVFHSSSFDGNVTSFSDGTHFKVVENDDAYTYTPAATCDALIITCPECRARTKIILPSFESSYADHEHRSLNFVSCPAPSPPPSPSLPPPVPGHVEAAISEIIEEAVASVTGADEASENDGGSEPTSPSPASYSPTSPNYTPTSSSFFP